MKYLIPILLTITVVGCSLESTATKYNKPTVAFSSVQGNATQSGYYQQSVNIRNSLDVKIPFHIGGIIDNKKTRTFNYHIDTSLLDNTEYKLMPEDYYSIEEIKVPAGQKEGELTIKMDSTSFLNDDKAVKPYYAIPITLVSDSTSGISVVNNNDQRSKIIIINYDNKYVGKYAQQGSFKTYGPSGELLNSGSFSDTLKFTTVSRDCVKVDGLINQKGQDYMMGLDLSDENNVSGKYLPNTLPVQTTNIAVKNNPEKTTSYVFSEYFDLSGINDGNIPDNPNGAGSPYNDYDHGDSLQWVQYKFSKKYRFFKYRVYWMNDNAGTQVPTVSYISYKDPQSNQFKKVPNSTPSFDLGKLVTKEFDSPFVTNTIRFYNKAGRKNPDNGMVALGMGYYEWDVFASEIPNSLEGRKISSVTTTEGTNNYNANNGSLQLNYKVNFEDGNYSEVNTKFTRVATDSTSN